MTSPASTAPYQNLTAAMVTQLSTGPAFREVAAMLLREQLQSLYPTLDIDPNVAMIGTPEWAIIEGEVVPIGRDYQALTDILAEQSATGVPVLYIEGEHFLTQLPIVEPAQHLPVRILDIASILNTLAPVMLRGYQQTQLDYWNDSEGDGGPRWHSLSAVLRNFWDVQEVPGWNDDDCRMARQLFRSPDLAARSLDDPYNTRAYVIDVDQIDEAGTVTHLNEHLISVLIGQYEGNEVILTRSLLANFKKYSTLAQLGEDLPLLLDTSITHKNVQWRLIEPDGDYFDYLACAFINIQIKAIGAIDFSDLRASGTSRHQTAQPPTPQSILKGPDLQQYVQALPEWLTSASTSDQDAYARHLKDLATLHSENEGQTYQDGISPLQQYAREQLNAELFKDHPQASHTALDSLDIVVRSPVIWGSFAVPGQIETTIFSLTELALQNLIALPLGIKNLRQSNTHSLPEWLTVDYVESLISRADIGNTYPALIKQTLLDGPEEATRRRRLYAEHLRIQLPMLALQCKIRDEGGIDEQGYRYVTALMRTEPAKRQVDGQKIVIRALAFLPTRRVDTAPDVVSNMFVIGPEDPATGPCLLYRPLLDKPLSQFPSAANLLYALQQSVSLRESVLAWLPEDARNDYAQYVFPGALPSPWTVLEFVADPFKLLTMGGPLALGRETLDGDLFSTLYDANANALITLADQQSVSNREARWATLKRAGWLIFNSALPFLGRTVGIAAWIWQIMDQLQSVVDAQAHPEQQSPWVALTDLLLNIGMAITLHSASRSAPRRQLEEKPLPPPRSPVTPASVVTRKLATINSDALATHDQPLHISGAVNRAPLRLATVLDSFKVNKPDTVAEANSETGTHQYLYRGGNDWYAPVGTRWFKVQVDENDAVLIVDALRPERTGPLLIHNNKGMWFVDTRLRLRGGGPKVMSLKARLDARRKADELRTQLEAFERSKKTAQDELQQARQEMDAGPSASTSAEARRQAYIQTLENQRSDYESALQQLKEMNVFEPNAEYVPKTLSYIKAQTKLTLAAMSEILARFTPQWRLVHEQMLRQTQTPLERHIEAFRELRELAGKLHVQLEYMHGRFVELKHLARDGVLLLNTLRGSMPVYTPEDLKALRLSLNRNLCLPEETLKTSPAAWLAIDHIVDTADVAVQCLRDTLNERSERRLDERIETLSSLVEQFQLVDERLQDFPVEFPEQAIADQLAEFRRELTYYKQRAITNLGILSVERTTLRTRPSPPSTPPRPKKQFIHTRFNGLLIGEPRLTDIGMETGLVDIRSPLTDQVLATYHEKPQGVWVRRDVTPPTSPTPVVVDVQNTIRQGQDLLDELPGFLARANTQANLVDRAPFGIEHLYHLHARRLEDAMGAIEHALTLENVTEGAQLHTSASAVTKALDTALADLYQLSHDHVLRTLKQVPPTVSGIEWLTRQDAISIKKTVTRRRIKGATSDYLDEYTVTERSTHEVLWYAHFHYSASWTPDKAYVSGRLKTVAEHRVGAAADTPQGLTPAQTLAFYRSEISLEQARQLFFREGKFI